MTGLAAGRLLAVSVTVAAAGCASSGEAARGAPGTWDERDAAPSRLHITNRHWLDVQIYAVRGSERYNLLSLTSMRTDSVPVPRSLLSGIGFRLMADPVGAVQPYYSDNIYLQPGQTVWWRLENVLAQSSLWIS